MAAAALRAQLNAHIAGMYTDGVVDEDTFEELRDEGTAVEVSRLFIYDGSEIIDDIDILMEEPEVDFDEVEALTQQLMQCTSSVGAQQVNLACMNFSNFYAIKYMHGSYQSNIVKKLPDLLFHFICKHVVDIIRCLVSLALVRNEFYIVRHELEVMMQLEEQIAACGPNS